MNELIFVLSGGILGSLMMIITHGVSFAKRLVLLTEGVAFLLLGELSLQRLLRLPSLPNSLFSGFLVFLLVSFFITTSQIKTVKGGE